MNHTTNLETKFIPDNYSFQITAKLPKSSYPPTQILEYIFPYLMKESADFHATSLVNRQWNSVLTQLAGNKISINKVIIKFFIDHISDNSIKDELSELLTQQPIIIESLNLTIVRFPMIDFSKKIINIIKKLDEKELINLEELSSNKYKPIDKLIKLAKLYYQNDMLKNIMTSEINIWLKNKRLYHDIAIELAELGDLDKSLEIALQIRGYQRTSTIIALVRILLKSGDVNKAIYLILNEIEYLQLLLPTISILFAEEKHFDEATKFALAITNYTQRKYANIRIVNITAKAGNYDTAIKLANTLSHQDRDSILMDTFEILIASCNFIGAITLVFYIFDSELQNSLIQKLFELKVFQEENISIAKIANTIPDTNNKKVVLDKLFVLFNEIVSIYNLTEVPYISPLD